MTNTNVVSINRSPANECPDVGTLIPAGEYRLVFVRRKLVTRFKRDVLELWFKVIDQGQYFEAPLPRYYSVKASGRHRSFTARPHGDFVRDYKNVFGQAPKFNAAPLEPFKSILVVGRVETVTTDYRQKPLSEPTRYSVIRGLLQREHL